MDTDGTDEAAPNIVSGVELKMCGGIKSSCVMFYL